MSIKSPAVLANMAIESILNEAGEKGLDGIRYLNAISNGIITPMTEEFKQNPSTSECKDFGSSY